VGKNEYLSTVLVPSPLKPTTSYPQSLSTLNKLFRVIHNLPTPVNNVVWEKSWDYLLIMAPQLKSLILSLVPPLALKAIREITLFLTGLKPGKISDYQNSELINSIILKHKKFQESFSKNNELNISDFRTIYGLLLAVNKNKINIVDFGGGPGTHYTIARKILPDVQFEWNIIETPKFVEEARKRNNSEIKFFSELGSITSLIDIMFTSSALQYTPDPIKSLSSIVERKARYLIITRTPFTQLAKIIGTQNSLLSENGPGESLKQTIDKVVTYQITVENIDLVEKIIKQHYNIKLKVVEETNVLKINKTNIDYYGYFCELK
jgi:putative methyltransferase (TIGR04325 family)